MKYCMACITPDTRPGIMLDDRSVCSACRQAHVKAQIDWGKRLARWRKLVAWAKAKRRRYDCVIPVSGGKDSTWQTVTCLRHGLRPLAVSWKPPKRTALGERNLANLIRLGVDHIDFTVNPAVERAFMLKTFRAAGSPAIPMHLALFNIPLTVAQTWDIPLVVWGENSAVEYGGDDPSLAGERLTEAWRKRYGVTLGTTADDWVSPELTSDSLAPYRGPSDAELNARGVRAVFLGHYFPWDPATSFAVARSHGFSARAAGSGLGYYHFADLDDDFIAVHHHLKWFKFGFTRLFDHLSLEIRRGRMTRAQAVAIVRERGDQTPHEAIKAFCSWAGIDGREFASVCERFRNLHIWVKVDGIWRLPDFLLKDWPWYAVQAARAASPVHRR